MRTSLEGNRRLSPRRQALQRRALPPRRSIFRRVWGMLRPAIVTADMVMATTPMKTSTLSISTASDALGRLGM